MLGEFFAEEKRKNAKIEEFDRVRLRSGWTAYVVEILGGGAAYLVDVDYEEGIETEFVYPEDIAEVLER